MTIDHYSGCTDGAEVVSIAVGGLDHSWSSVDNTGDWDGTQRITEFIVNHGD